MPAKLYETLDAVPLSAFSTADDGSIRCGIRHHIRTRACGLEKHECYQFDQYNVFRTAREMQSVPGMERVELVRYDLGYKNLRVLHVWVCDKPGTVFHEDHQPKL